MGFFGLIVILFFTGLAVQLTMSVGDNPDFISILNNISPVLGSNSTIIGWVSAGVIAISGLILPILMVKKDGFDGRDRLAEVGFFSSILSSSFSVFYLIVFVLAPFVAYLLTMFWFFATQYLPAQ